MTSRRGFLGLLATVAAGATLDPERAVWVPGQKLISIAAPSKCHDFIDACAAQQEAIQAATGLPAYAFASYSIGYIAPSAMLQADREYFASIQRIARQLGEMRRARVEAMAREIFYGRVE